MYDQELISELEWLGWDYRELADALLESFDALVKLTGVVEGLERRVRCIT